MLLHTHTSLPITERMRDRRLLPTVRVRPSLRLQNFALHAAPERRILEINEFVKGYLWKRKKTEMQWRVDPNSSRNKS